MWKVRILEGAADGTATETTNKFVEWVKANPSQFTLLLLAGVAVVGIGILLGKSFKKPRRKR